MRISGLSRTKLVIGGFDIRAKTHTSEDQFYKVMANAHALFPAIQGVGVHGYYTVTDNALELFRKLFEASNSTVTWSLTKIPVSTWQELLKVLPDIGTVSAGYDIRASRLISRQTVTEKTEEFAAVYKKIGPTKEAPSNGLPNLSISGTLTISPKPVNNALHPSWRNATVYLITGQSWTDSTNDTAVRNIIHDVTYRKLTLLRELDLAQGVYLNEVRWHSMITLDTLG
ncbi:hypothetical protein BFJ70_g10851 [Fusarium oxysporum]|uniref:Uncharacterized protein n=1 Tax=Fusarium oxysporum TaxID=5507 RepID=A0A420SIR4_FUSOX|nr:hypothetical protein BFJ68_g9440 [Fusarium oxysporum]RKL29140.1 hypothetical protein BFJ70_g10851 [Fusarium oxysporum]